MRRRSSYTEIFCVLTFVRRENSALCFVALLARVSQRFCVEIYQGEFRLIAQRVFSDEILHLPEPARTRCSKCGSFFQCARPAPFRWKCFPRDEPPGWGRKLLATCCWQKMNQTYRLAVVTLRSVAVDHVRSFIITCVAEGLMKRTIGKWGVDHRELQLSPHARHI